MKLKNVNGYWMIDDNPSSAGVKGMISWPKVVAALRDAGVVREDEEVVELKIDHNGLMFTVEKRE